MQKIINTIINKNYELFGKNPKVIKINVGFTNTIYNINDLYIVKICTNPKNESNFKREIRFYNSNSKNHLIPKLYYASEEKENIPYCYEIIEKINGVSLYNVWHKFSENQREEIIRQLCSAMKQIHATKGSNYDWVNHLKKEFTLSYSKAQELHIFNEEEKQSINQAYSKFEKYLKSSDFVLIHNDLHFDNIIYNEGQIKIIDFERSMFAPRDFELDILFRMIKKPWKFASEETEQYTDINDYANIKLYIEKYYPELINIPFLNKRLAIYDLVYFLEQIIDYPDNTELKEDIILASKIVIEN